MNDLIRSEESNSELSVELIELGQISEETKGAPAGITQEVSVLPMRT